MTSIRARWIGIAVVVLVIGSMSASIASGAPGPTRRYVVIVDNPAQYKSVRADLTSRGATLLGQAHRLGWFVVRAPSSVLAVTAGDRRMTMIRDHMERIALPEVPQPRVNAPGLESAKRVALPASRRRTNGAEAPDPAATYPGLQWNMGRIGARKVWKKTLGDSSVTVGVADTGLDYTHSDLAGQVKSVQDFTLTEDPPICSDLFGFGDQDVANEFGVPADLDFNGHGSWIGGNIAANLDGSGMNGIAPGVKLVSLKISQWCGFAFDSEILMAYLWAANHNVDIVSNSFGGYLDRTDPEQEEIWQMYVKVVAYARGKGTTIVAAAGNEATQIGAAGLATSHGPLTSPDTAPSDFTDFFGLYEVPGGAPGVVDVGSTGRVVNTSSNKCPLGTIGDPGHVDAICKPKADAHQAAGAGLEDQLAYYSNYGSRIDVTAPGGARKFNLPFWDRGGTPGFPVTTSDGTNVWEAFSITSNYALEIPCYTFGAGTGFPANECYSSIQGTSMATPHAAGALALIASVRDKARHHPGWLISLLKNHARGGVTNETEVLSASDTSGGDLVGSSCPTSYCHLGGSAVPSSNAYGAGIVDVRFLVEKKK